ncbi:MAG: DUF1302 family protein [Pseudomonadota bacterium]
MKKNIIATVIGLGFLLSMAGADNVSAYTWDALCGKFKLSGRLENFTGWRTQDHAVLSLDRPGEPIREAGDLAIFRNTLQLEMEYSLGEHFSIFSIYRLAYEGGYDVQSVDDRPRDQEFIQDELRELYVTLAFDEWTFKIGKQQLVWGETDVLRMADVINPLDLSWNWSNETWEDIRRPLRMIVATYAPERFVTNNVSLEAVFIPEDFKATLTPRPGSNWHIDLAGWELFRTAYRAGEPNDNNDEYGFRLRGVIKGAEVSVFDWYGRLDGGVVNLDHFIGFLTGTHGVGFVDYPKFNSTGATLNWFDPWTRTVWRFEGSYNFEEPFNDSFFRIQRWDSLNFMIGFDRPTWIRLLNPEQTWFLSFQWFHKNILDYKHSYGLISPSQSNDQYQNIAIFLMTSGYKNNIYTPTLAVAYDLSGTWFVAPSFKYNFNSELAFTIGANFYIATTTRDSIWGTVRDNDQVYFRIRYGFR